MAASSSVLVFLFAVASFLAVCSAQGGISFGIGFGQPGGYGGYGSQYGGYQQPWYNGYQQGGYNRPGGYNGGYNNGYGYNNNGYGYNNNGYDYYG